MKLLSIFSGLLCLAGANVRAELPPQAPAPAPAPVAPAPSPNPTPASVPGGSRGINVFNDQVFEFSSDKPAADTIVSPATGDKRYLGAAPTYNTQQRQEWIEKCSGNENPRDCFTQERKANEDKLRQGQDAIEQRQAQPYRNAVPILDQSGDKREPAFGGVDNQDGKRN